MSELRHQLNQDRKCLATPLSRTEGERPVAPGDGDRQKRGNQRRSSIDVDADSREHFFELVEPPVRRILPFEANGVLNLRYHRIKRAILVIRLPLKTKPGVPFALDAPKKPLHRARLADARSAANQSRPTLARRGLPPTPPQ